MKTTKISAHLVRIRALERSTIAIVCILAAVGNLSRADMKPTDSDKPVFRFLGKKVDFTVSAIHRLIVRPDQKGVTIVLNKDDGKKLVELIKKLSRAEIHCEVVG